MSDKIIVGNRLLVIDHEPAVGRLIKSAAEDQGFEVILTEDPSTVVKTAKGWFPTVIILDLRTPGIDGIQLLRGLAEDKCAAHVILTSGADDEIMASAIQLGRDRGLKMSGILHKPVRVKILWELLAQVLTAKMTLLIDDLPNAIEADQLFLEYQLKLDCRLARMTGAEALVRWRHPTLGLIQPAQFIPLVEESDLIHRLTDWVVTAAAKQIADWQADNPTLNVAVNISAKNLENLDFPDRLHQHCQDVGIDCASMTLELTETGVMREAVRMMDVLTRLRLKGFKLSIDDFGTGYSSLAQLQKMPFSEIKIDQSFVIPMMANKDCKVIVESVIDLARKLQLKSVAEGVEDENTLRCLMAWGCDVAQGYHLSRPVAAEVIPTFIFSYQLMKEVPKAAKPEPPSPFANPRAWQHKKIAQKGGTHRPRRLEPIA